MVLALTIGKKFAIFNIMIYKADIDRYVSKNGLIYRYDKHNDKLVLCSENEHHGYSWCSGWKNGKRFNIPFHRIVWETFNGEIPEGLEIDHMDNNRKNNALSNLQLVTRAENNRLRFVRGFKATGNKKKYLTEFGKLFFEKYGFSESKDVLLYNREYRHWKKYGRLKDV